MYVLEVIKYGLISAVKVKETSSDILYYCMKPSKLKAK